MTADYTPFSLDDLAALERAIASGHQSVAYAGGTVVYRSQRDMERTADRIRGTLGLPALWTRQAGRDHPRATVGVVRSR